MKNAIIHSGIRSGALSLVLAISSTGYSADWFVKSGQSGSGDSWANATSLENACQKANDGDAIYVAAGEYNLTRQITLSKTITIKGGYVGNESRLDKSDGSKNRVVIKGTPGSRAMAVNIKNGAVSPLVLEGLSFVGFEPAEKNNGAAIMVVYTASSIKMNQLSFEGCKVVTSNSDDATRGSNGGAIYFNNLPDRVKYSIENCRFVACEAREGGAIYVNSSTAENGKEVEIDGCSFVNNKSVGNGGALYLRMGNRVEIEKSLFADNVAGVEDLTGSGGAIYIHFKNEVKLDGSTFYGNKATQKGSVVFGNGNAENTNKVDIKDCVMIENYASRSNNGRFAVDADNIGVNNVYTVENSVIANNQNAKNGTADMTHQAASSENLIMNSVVNGAYVVKKTADELSVKPKYSDYLTAEQVATLKKSVGIKDASVYKK